MIKDLLWWWVLQIVAGCQSLHVLSLRITCAGVDGRYNKIDVICKFKDLFFFMDRMELGRCNDI